MSYEAVIGLEIHIELKTATKLFCRCENSSGGEPNSRICPVCTGQPGALPSTNERAVKLALLACATLGCEINPRSAQCRKHYFYPDLPKGYQISQRETPLGKNGSFTFFDGQNVKTVGIEQVHLEEDAGKLVHLDNGKTGIDFNRAGVPLIEIVTRPELHSAGDVRSFLEALRRTLIRAGVSECRMEQGALRCDVNVSVRQKGENKLNERVEMKNINSFSGAERAVEYEFERQIELIKEGKPICRETRRWDDDAKRSVIMRTKETAPDYKFMPDPDIPEYIISEELRKTAFKAVPESELSKRQKYSSVGISENDINIIISDIELEKFIDVCATIKEDLSECAKLLVGDCVAILTRLGLTLSHSKLSPKGMCELSSLIENGAINRQGAKKILEKMLLSGEGPQEYADEYQLLSDEEILRNTVSETVSESKKAVADYKKGKSEAFSYLMGQCMRKLRGRASAQQLKEILNSELKKEMQK